MNRYLLGMMLLAACSNVHAEEFDAKVIVVMDGDTVMVLRDGKKVRVRLANIDAPESDQEFGKESRQALADRVLKKQVHVNSRAVDIYGRMIAEISLDGQSINEEQVSKGMAWEYSHFHRNKHYLELSKQARQLRRGLWARSVQPVSPDQWRKLHISSVRVTLPADGCGKMRHCSQMHSCGEAKYYMNHCNAKYLDGNGDGIPCENLCKTGGLE